MKSVMAVAFGSAWMGAVRLGDGKVRVLRRRFTGALAKDAAGIYALKVLFRLRRRWCSR